MIRLVPAIAAFVAILSSTSAAELVLAENGRAVPVIVAPDAPPSARQAAGKLADYIFKISGARPEVIAAVPNPAPDRAIWVSVQSPVKALFPGTKLDLAHPEETLIAANEQHVLIAGRDRTIGDKETEHGTSNAVYSFIEKQLGVRWLWPGPLGEDVPRQPQLTVTAPYEARFHPPFRFRRFWPQQPPEWHRAQRLLDHSLRFEAGHGFTDWWDKYSAERPDYFAQLPNGTRKPQRSPEEVKLCVSNPAVAAQWLKNAEEAFKSNPSKQMMSISPNDSGGFCVCARCRAMDHPDGPPTMGYVALTDRYVKFWNIAARGLAQRFPGRDAWVGAYAYSAYRTPPIAEKLEANIAIGYVGHFPLAGEAVRKQEKEQWRAWAKQARAMVFRPNLFHFSGGFLGLPNIALRNTIEDFRFLAENQCIGIEIDTLPMCWATQGVQYYVMAQLAYDPLQDGEAVVRDYCARGFGPGAADVRQHFAALEAANDAVLERIKHSSGWAREATEVFQEIFTAERWSEAEKHLAAAEQKAAGGPAAYRERLAFLRNGFEAAKAQIDVLRAMKIVRESGGKDTAAIQRADELCAKRDTLFAEYKGLAVRRSKWYVESRRLTDYVDPPSEAMRRGEYTPPKPLRKDAAKE